MSIPNTRMKKMIAYGGSALALASTFIFLYKFKSKIQFQSFKILDKSSLIFILKQIRSEFSQQFTVPLKLLRRKRRAAHRGGRDYRNLIKESKDQAKEYIQKSVEVVLARYKLTEDVLSETYKYFEGDIEVKSVLSKICCIESSKVPAGIDEKLEIILETFVARFEEFNESDPNEMNVQLKVLEDDIFDEFGCEPEEIEAAIAKDPSSVQGLVKMISELNEEILAKTNQELFF